MRRNGWLVVVMLVALPAGAAAQEAQPLSWLIGCWRMTRGQSVVEERWSDLQGGLMLGTGRTVRAGRAVEYEFVRITVDGDALAYHALPSGQRPATFPAVARGADSVVFSNPAHDFPTTVAYRRLGADSLLAWIAGGTRRTEFRYGRIPCT